MRYRPGHQTIDNRIGAVTYTIFPASVISGFVGTCILTLGAATLLFAAGEFATISIVGFLGLLIAAGASIALGTIAGSVVVAFYLALFGLPIALLLGERIREPIGLLAAVASAIIASGLAMVWLSGARSDALDPNRVAWEWIAAITAFAAPAFWFYRRNIIMALDELAAA